MTLVNKVILDLCGGTGAWSRPYADAGYAVHNITLPDWDVTKAVRHEEGIIFYAPNSRRSLQVEAADIHGILAAPPCTEFSIARTTAKTPRNFNLGVSILEACLKIIWHARAQKKLGFWAIENPRGLMRQFLGHPRFTFEQWEFGDPGIKPTDLWGWFKAPHKSVIDRPDGLTRTYPCGSSMSKNWNVCVPGLTKADVRAITPPGFAQAFYRANK